MLTILNNTDLFSLLPQVNGIVHGVNINGVMGAGIAKVIKQKYLRVFDEYREYCEFNKFSTDMLGRITVTDLDTSLSVFNLFSQELGRRALPCAIELGLITLQEYVGKYTHYNSLVAPAIGCGLGGLTWITQVYPIFNRVFGKSGVHMIVCQL